MKSIKKAISLFLVLVMVTSILSVNALAMEHDSYALNGASVTVDGSEDVTVDVTFKKASGTALLRAFGGYFSLSETEESSSYLALTALTPGSTEVNINPVTQENDVVSGHISWTEVEGVAIEENAPIWTATYTVNKNTPTGEYTVSLTQLAFVDDAFLGDGLDSLSGQTYTATINVTYKDSSVASTGAALSAESLELTEGGTATLTASLLPEDTTEKISGIVWTSSNADAATVEGGVVTAVAAGETTITAKVTTSAGAEYNAACTVTVTEAVAPASSYTVTIADATDGTARVHAGDTVAMDVKVTGGSFNAYDIYVIYDTDAFTYADDTQNIGEIHIQNIDKTIREDGTSVAALSFTARDVEKTTTGDFGFQSAVVQSPADADNDAAQAAIVTDSVTVVKQYTVTFQDKDGNDIEGAVCTVDDGASVTIVPDAPEVDNYTFDSWYVGGKSYTADEIKEQVVTADVTYQAVYAPNTYTVTLGDGLTDANGNTGGITATYGEDFTGKITDIENGYSYTVTYQVGENGEKKTAALNTETGAFTIPGADITDKLTVSVTKALDGITVTAHDDFITGYTLIEVAVTGTGAGNYSYGGHDMYYVAAAANGNYGSYVYLIQGEADSDKVQISENARIEISTDKVNDVNMTGVVDFSDANAAFCIYNQVDVWSLESEKPVDNLIEKIIRADVNRDYVVNSADVDAILNAI